VVVGLRRKKKRLSKEQNAARDTGDISTGYCGIGGGGETKKEFRYKISGNFGPGK